MKRQKKITTYYKKRIKLYNCSTINNYDIYTFTKPKCMVLEEHIKQYLQQHASNIESTGISGDNVFYTDLMVQKLLMDLNFIIKDKKSEKLDAVIVGEQSNPMKEKIITIVVILPLDDCIQIQREWLQKLMVFTTYKNLGYFIGNLKFILFHANEINCLCTTHLAYYLRYEKEIQYRVAVQSRVINGVYKHVLFPMYLLKQDISPDRITRFGNKKMERIIVRKCVYLNRPIIFKLLPDKNIRNNVPSLFQIALRKIVLNQLYFK